MKKHWVFIPPQRILIFFERYGRNKLCKKMTNKELTPSESSSYWYTEGFDFISSHPLDAIKLTFKKLLFFLDDDENPRHHKLTLIFLEINILQY